MVDKAKNAAAKASRVGVIFSFADDWAASNPKEAAAEGKTARTVAREVVNLNDTVEGHRQNRMELVKKEFTSFAELCRKAGSDASMLTMRKNFFQ